MLQHVESRFSTSAFALLSCFIGHFYKVYVQTSDMPGLFLMWFFNPIPGVVKKEHDLSAAFYCLNWMACGGWRCPTSIVLSFQISHFVITSALTSALGSKEININGFAHSADNVSHCTCEPKHLTVHFEALCSHFYCECAFFCGLPVGSACLLRFPYCYILNQSNPFCTI